jgi:riboflavin synthase
LFTGIVTDIGRIRALEPRGGDVRLVVAVNALPLARMSLGDSIAVAGVCLTATELQGTQFAADVSRETLDLTTLGRLALDSRVNLEAALRAGDPLGGHLVSGHVDGVATVQSAEADARSLRLRFRVPAGLSRYIARKGSVTIDGVSLTVNDVAGEDFGVNLIPHTQEVTTLGGLEVGDRVNIEIDQMARYAERLLGVDGAGASK